MAKRSTVLANLPFAPVIAALFAIVAVVLVIATPQWLFERWVALSGIASLIPAATPPLGEKARIASAVFAGIATGALLWGLLTFAARAMAPKGTSRARGSNLDRADKPMSGSGPNRRPLFADAELGAPLMSEEAMAQARDELVLDAPLAEADLPVRDGDVPTASGPEAIVDLPQSAPAAAPDAVPLPEPEPHVFTRPRSGADESISTLLERLEAAIARKPMGYRPDRTDIATLRRAMGSARS